MKVLLLRAPIQKLMPVVCDSVGAENTSVL